jgi:hypothetical protein
VRTLWGGGRVVHDAGRRADEREKCAPLPIGALRGVFSRPAQHGVCVSAGFVWGWRNSRNSVDFSARLEEDGGGADWAGAGPKRWVVDVVDPPYPAAFEGVMSGKEFPATRENRYFPRPNHVPIGSDQFRSGSVRFQGSMGSTGVLGGAVFEAGK